MSRGLPFDEALEGPIRESLTAWITKDQRREGPWIFTAHLRLAGGEPRAVHRVNLTKDDFRLEAVDAILDNLRQDIESREGTAIHGVLRLRGYHKDESGRTDTWEKTGAFDRSFTIRQDLLPSRVEFAGKDFGHMERLQYHQSMLGMAAELRQTTTAVTTLAASLGESLQNTAAVRTMSGAGNDMGSGGLGGIGSVVGLLALSMAAPVFAPMLGVDMKKSLGPLLQAVLQGRVGATNQQAVQEGAINQKITQEVLGLTDEEAPKKPHWMLQSIEVTPVAALPKNEPVDEASVLAWLQADPARAKSLVKVAAKDEKIKDALKEDAGELISIFMT